MKKNVFKFLIAIVLFLGMGSAVKAESTTDSWTKDSGVNYSFDLDNKVVIFDGKGTVNVTNDFAAFIVISEDADITINLNGHTISTVEGVWYDITENYPSISHVHNYGKLTINGEGTIINKTPLPGGDGTYGNATLINMPGATMVLNGGLYTRGKTTDGKTNAGYVIRNLGDLTINGNARLDSGDTGTNSALISSGWNLDDSTQNYGYTTPTTPIELTINGGEYFGGRRAINTEGNTVTTINGGSFENSVREVIKSASVTVINDGVFKSPTGKNVITTEGDGTFEVVNGEFSSDVSKYLNVDSEIITNDDGSYSVSFVYADYSKIDEIIEKVIDEGVDTYTEESITVLEKELEKVDWELGKSKQADVDKMVEAVTKAFNQLKKIENPKTGNSMVTYIISAIIMILGISGCIIYKKKLFN